MWNLLYQKARSGNMSNNDSLELKITGDELRVELKLRRLEKELKTRERQEKLAEREKLLAMEPEERELYQLEELERKRIIRKKLREESKDREMESKLLEAWGDNSIKADSDMLVQISAGISGNMRRN